MRISDWSSDVCSSDLKAGRFPNVDRWGAAMLERPAVAEGMTVGVARAETIEGGLTGSNDEHRAILWGVRQHAKRSLPASLRAKRAATGRRPNRPQPALPRSVTDQKSVVIGKHEAVRLSHRGRRNIKTTTDTNIKKTH